MCASAALGEHGGHMRGTPFLKFHRAAEAAGYPALLIVSAVCLGLVVVPVGLLGLTRAGWVLAEALLCLIAAVIILTAAIDAALSDVDEPAEGPAGREAEPNEGVPVVRLEPRQPIDRQAGQGRKAA
jgi:hypothetical protein